MMGDAYDAKADLKVDEWNASYHRRENFVFYPHEEVIRFISSYVCRQTGWRDMHWHLPPGDRRALAIGCGVGRHVFYLHDCGLEAWGIDLSEAAIELAREEARRRDVSVLEQRLIAGSAAEMPFDDSTFQVAVSHGVLDSMPFATACQVMVEAHRVLEPGGLVYLDLVSGDDGRHGREFAGEEMVADEHEHGTIQSYFNYGRILELLQDKFTLLDVHYIQRRGVLRPGVTSRYHLVLESSED